MLNKVELDPSIRGLVVTWSRSRQDENQSGHNNTLLDDRDTNYFAKEIHKYLFSFVVISSYCTVAPTTTTAAG